MRTNAPRALWSDVVAPERLQLLRDVAATDAVTGAAALYSAAFLASGEGHVRSVLRKKADVSLSAFAMAGATEWSVFDPSGTVAWDVSRVVQVSALVSLVCALLNVLLLRHHVGSLSTSLVIVAFPLLSIAVAWVVYQGVLAYPPPGVLHILVLFTAFGIGIDDVCVMYYSMVHDTRRREFCRSIVVTTVTDVFAFAASLHSGVAAVRQVSAFAIVVLASTLAVTLLLFPHVVRPSDARYQRTCALTAHARTLRRVALVVLVGLAATTVQLLQVRVHAASFRFSAFDASTNLMRAVACENEFSDALRTAPVVLLWTTPTRDARVIAGEIEATRAALRRLGAVDVVCPTPECAPTAPLPPCPCFDGTWDTVYCWLRRRAGAIAFNATHSLHFVAARVRVPSPADPSTARRLYNSVDAVAARFANVTHDGSLWREMQIDESFVGSAAACVLSTVLFIAAVAAAIHRDARVVATLMGAVVFNATVTFCAQ